MTMPTYQKLRQSGYSLIELLIVMFILAALLTVIVPKIAFTQMDAALTATDYNLAGINRYVKMYNALYGSYPAGLHTGFDDSTQADGATIEDVADPISVDLYLLTAGTTAATTNETAATDVNLVPEVISDGVGALQITGMAVAAGPMDDAGALSACEAISLAKAGISTLFSGGVGAATTVATRCADFANPNTVANGFTGAANATEWIDTTTGANTGCWVTRINQNAAVKTGGSIAGAVLTPGAGNLTVSSQTTNNWAANLNPLGLGVPANQSFVVLYVGNNVDWFNYYSDFVFASDAAAASASYNVSAQSVVGLAEAPRSPLVTKLGWGYYGLVFAVDNSIVSTVQAAAGATTAASFTAAELVTIIDAGNLRNLNP